MDIIFYDFPTNHETMLMLHPAIGSDGFPSYDLPPSYGLQSTDPQHMIRCDNNQGLGMTCGKNMEEVNYKNVSLQKIEINNDTHKIAMKLKVADKDGLAIKSRATRCGFKVK